MNPGAGPMAAVVGLSFDVGEARDANGLPSRVAVLDGDEGDVGDVGVSLVVTTAIDGCGWPDNDDGADEEEDKDDGSLNEVVRGAGGFVVVAVVVDTASWDAFAVVFAVDRLRGGMINVDFTIPRCVPNRLGGRTAAAAATPLVVDPTFTDAVDKVPLTPDLLFKRAERGWYDVMWSLEPHESS